MKTNHCQPLKMSKNFFQKPLDVMVAVVVKYPCSRPLLRPINHARTRIQFDSRVLVEADKPRLHNGLCSSNRAGRRPQAGLAAGLGFILPRTVNGQQPELDCSPSEGYLVNADVQTRQLDEKTGLVKNVARLFLPNYRSNRESYPRQRVKGFGWLPVCLLILKTHTLVRKETLFMYGKPVMGLPCPRH